MCWRPCCKRNVLIWEAGDWFGQRYGTLADYLQSAGYAVTLAYRTVPGDDMLRAPGAGSLPTNEDVEQIPWQEVTNPRKYPTIIAPMASGKPEDFTPYSGASGRRPPVPVDAEWFDGRRRLAITGEFSEFPIGNPEGEFAFDQSNAYVNDLMASLGSALRVPTYQQGGFRDGASMSYGNPDHYLSYQNNGSTTPFGMAPNDTNEVRGGTPLFDTEHGPTVGTIVAAVERVGSGEVVVCGDSNIFGGSADFDAVNQAWLRRLCNRVRSEDAPP